MIGVRDALVRALSDLQELAVPHALIGGLAVSARVEPRMTRDVDVAVAAADDDAAEQVVHAMQARGYRVSSVIEQTATERLATVRLVPGNSSPSGVVVDLLFASSGIEPELVRDAEAIEVFRGVTAPVATVGHLIALKLLAASEARPQDNVDLRRLVDIAVPGDVDTARRSVRTIAARGYARGRDLEKALVQLLSSRPE
ncbi:MAG TPA: nucleotidyl transferase AbiEii/AbiGii toxin family protein [Polyangiaceae bacterium]